MKYFRFIAAYVYTAMAALLALSFMDLSADGWFAQIVKPAPALPHWLFGVLWLANFFPLAAAHAIVWMGPPSHARDGWVRYYFIQLLFNVAFVFFFFWLNALTLSLLIALILWLLSMAMIAAGHDRSRKIVYLLLPYQLLMIYTVYLVLNVWRLN